MTMRLDIVTNDAGELVRLEHARDMGSANVQAVYRLVKLAQLHDLTNQAFTRQLEQTSQSLTEYGIRAGAHFNVLFASKAVFVGGQLLKASRPAYEMASELGDMMEWCGGSDLTIQRDVTQKELYMFAEAVTAGVRGQKGGGAFRAPPKIKLRPVTDAARFRGLEIEDLPFEQRVVRTYASAVVIMRRFFQDLESSRYVLPRRIKRVAQSLVDLSEGSTPAFLGVTDVRNQNFDDAGRAVNTAILAVSMARQLTNDRVLLAQIAMAAMMHDVGRPRAAALGEGGPRMPGAVRLSEDAEDKLAAGTAAVLTALGRLNEPTITRTVVTFEALWMRRERFLGPLYGSSRHPTIHAKIVQIARRYNDLVTPEPGLPPPQPDFAVATISQEMPAEADRTVLRLLVATLNLLPVGTTVQLTTQEVAEIIPSKGSVPDARAWVRILCDARGAPLPRPLEVDLTMAPRQGDAPRKIARVLSIDGWGKGAELIPEEEAPPTSGPSPLSPLPADTDAHEAAEPGGHAFEPPPEDPGTGQSASSVPSIASILSLPNPGVRDVNSIPPINESPSAPPEPNPASGTSPSMVAQAMGKAIAEGGPRPPTRATRSVALFEDPMPDVVGMTPTARGTLTSTPIVHVLVYMLDHRQTGSVVLREPDGRHHVIYFQEGFPSVVRNGRPIALLGDGLVAAGVLSPEALVKALEVARRSNTLIGEYLVNNSLVGAEALRIALSAQIARKLERIVNLAPDTDYAFYSDINLIPEWAGGQFFPCHPLTAILAAVRSWHDRARLRATLGRIARQPLTFHPDVDLSSLVLTGEEQSVVDAIRSSPATISAIYDQRLADEDIVSSLVYTFAVTRSFSFTAAKGPPMVCVPEQPIEVADEVVITGASDPPPPLLSQTAALGPVALAIESMIPPPVVPRPSPSGSIPPAQSSRPAPVESGPVEAPRSMNNPVRKAQPRAASNEEENPERALQAMTDFQNAEAALARDDLAKAAVLARKAQEGEPSNPDYNALVAWIGALSGPKEIPLAIAKLNVILKDEALCERALLYRGRLYKRAKRTAEALRDFSTVLDINPNNAEAAGEARVLRMTKKK